MNRETITMPLAEIEQAAITAAERKDELEKTYYAANAAYRGAERAENKANNLRSDVRMRDLRGETRIVMPEAYRGRGCVVKKGDAEQCPSDWLSYRICIWDGDDRIVAMFCSRHKRHVEHYGLKSCYMCGSEIIVGAAPAQSE